MFRRPSSSDLAIDLGIARSTDFSAPAVSARVSPKWRAPRPVSWPPALPAHRVPESAPRSVPPNRFHEPVLHSPLLLPRVEPRKSHVGLWVTLLFVIAAGAAGFVQRERLLSNATAAASWIRSQIPSDLADRPRIAWERAQELAALGASRVRSLVPGMRGTQGHGSSTPAPPADHDKLPSPSAIVPSAPAAPAEGPVVAVSALPIAAPVPVARSAPHARPPATTEVSASAASPDAPQSTSQEAPAAVPVHPVVAAPPAHPVAAPPAHVPSDAPASSPAPEPGSLDDLIRRAVEKESGHKH
jgi:hypothetical protein